MLDKSMLTIFTIVLNGEPFISKKLEIYQKLTIPWQWRIVEGVSNPGNCTRWCREVPSKWHKDFVSIDGTNEYLKNLKHPKVSFQYQNKPFDGKIEMIRRALEGVDCGVVMEQDADEFWTEKQMEDVYRLLIDRTPGTAAQFFCNYHIGKKVVVSRSGLGCYPYEWYRAWKWGEGIEFASHEPPILNHQPIRIPRGVTEEMGLVFDHFAYSVPAQVEFKQDFYGYAELLKSWEKLQKTHGPVRLNRYFTHVQDRSVVDDAT
jgi:hypothetical protein